MRWAGRRRVKQRENGDVKHRNLQLTLIFPYQFADKWTTKYPPRLFLRRHSIPVYLNAFGFSPLWHFETKVDLGSDAVVQLAKEGVFERIAEEIQHFVNSQPTPNWVAIKRRERAGGIAKNGVGRYNFLRVHSFAPSVSLSLKKVSLFSEKVNLDFFPLFFEKMTISRRCEQGQIWTEDLVRRLVF